MEFERLSGGDGRPVPSAINDAVIDFLYVLKSKKTRLARGLRSD
jgi:hypothetical protein